MTESTTATPALSAGFKKMRVLLSMAILVLGFAVAGPSAAAAGADVEPAGTDLGDRGSLQRGAQLYMNYCAACHSLKYLRYSRIGEDLGLTEDEVMENLNFTGAPYGEVIQASMPPESAQWFGKVPPDLTLITRVRGSDWVYTYLKSFYLDEASTLGWNNTVYPNVSMPNPLWKLQGVQHPVYGQATEAGADRPVVALKVTQPGTMDDQAFNQAVRDITAFLEYAGEPAALKRQSIGVWVILFLALLTFLAWLLKQEYWRDVKH